LRIPLIFIFSFLVSLDFQFSSKPATLVVKFSTERSSCFDVYFTIWRLHYFQFRFSFPFRHFALSLFGIETLISDVFFQTVDFHFLSVQAARRLSFYEKSFRDAFFVFSESNRFRLD
jgi:hypothetical protein